MSPKIIMRKYNNNKDGTFNEMFLTTFYFYKQVRVGVVVFSTSAENVFYLNDHLTKSDVQDAIQRYTFFGLITQI